MSGALLLSGLVVFVTHTLEAITGFGCSVLAMPFVSSLLGVHMAVKVITFLAWFLALYLVVRNYAKIDWKQYAIITGCMLIGLPVGMYLFRTQQSDALNLMLALFIIIVSLSQLYRLARGGAPQAPLTKKTALPYYLLLVAGGVIHGIFSSGGPLVVLYATRTLPDKGRFRATLCLLWTTLNTIILATYFLEGSVTREIAVSTGILIPFVVAGIIVGERIHNKVDQKKFSLIVFSMLLLTGVFMLISR